MITERERLRAIASTREAVRHLDEINKQAKKVMAKWAKEAARASTQKLTDYLYELRAKELWAQEQGGGLTYYGRCKRDTIQRELQTRIGWW